MIYSSIIETIGNTPIVELRNVNPGYPGVRIYAKLEGFNPSGSLKDRIVKYMLEKAQENGELTKDKILIEPTSGNTGISIATFAKLKGYSFTAVIPENVSKERLELIRGLGGELILTDGAKGTNGSIQVAKEMVQKDSKYFMLDQYSNPNNVLAHYETTAPEIIDEVPNIDIFVAGLGTGGTLMGVGRRLKENNPATRIVAVQPYPQKGGLAGLRSIWDGYVPPIFDFNKVDANEPVMAVDAFIWTRKLAQEEGIFAGISSGAVTYIAAGYAKTLKSGVIVVLLADGGWKYISEKILTEEPEKIAKRIEGPLW